jgi:outer membrane protein OmpA-like peptidoglycan-associated protein
MTRALLAATFLASLACLPVAARAQPITGLYVGAGAGGNFMTNEKVRDSSAAGSVTRKSKFSAGAVGLGSIGWGFGNGLRLEAEGDYRFNKIDGHPAGPGLASVGGWERKYGGMVNALFDFDIGSPYVFPYAGVGAGYMRAQRLTTARPVGGLPGTRDYSVGGAAVQGIAGVSLPVPFVVGLSATIEYRFLGIEDTKDRVALVSAAGGTGTLHKVVNDHNQSALIGLRYAFNVVPPTPPAAAAVPAAPPQPEAARSYLVFFDWDRADLSARARQIIADAAQASSRVRTTRIEVSGHADRTGTPAYNQALSMRRAESVAGELVRDGVARGAIAIRAFGDTKPLVATAAGVREPQNRRVEIVLR